MARARGTAELGFFDLGFGLHVAKSTPPATTPSPLSSLQLAAVLGSGKIVAVDVALVEHDVGPVVKTLVGMARRCLEKPVDTAQAQ